MRRAALLLPLVLALCGAPPAAEAELVVFTDGGFLKVAGFEIEGRRVRLDLRSGGRMVVSILRVARILEDEVTDEVAAPPEAIDPPAFELAFHPAQPRPATPYSELIWGAGERYALNPALLAAVVRAESAFDPRAVSHKGAQGLMQLMPATARRFGLRGAAVFEPEKNLDAGARYLAWLAERFEGELAHVLAAYNAGEGTVDRYGGVPPYRETHGYLQRIYAELGLDGSAWSPPAAGGG